MRALSLCAVKLLSRLLTALNLLPSMATIASAQRSAGTPCESLRPPTLVDKGFQRSIVDLIERQMVDERCDDTQFPDRVIDLMCRSSST
jgi:hypothetical protein